MTVGPCSSRKLLKKKLKAVFSSLFFTYLIYTCFKATSLATCPSLHLKYITLFYFSIMIEQRCHLFYKSKGSLFSLLSLFFKLDSLEIFLMSSLFQIQMFCFRKEELTPVCFKVFEKNEEKETVPNIFYKARITLIQKPDKDITRKKITWYYPL